jgi:transposase InsO family protein
MGAMEQIWLLELLLLFYLLAGKFQELILLQILSLKQELVLPLEILLSDRVSPFIEEQHIPILRILTDRGKEYKGKPEHHKYELYLNIEGFEHSKNQVRRPQSNGICERLHRSIQDEFYAKTIRKKLH